MHQSSVGDVFREPPPALKRNRFTARESAANMKRIHSDKIVSAGDLRTLGRQSGLLRWTQWFRRDLTLSGPRTKDAQGGRRYSNVRRWPMGGS